MQRHFQVVLLLGIVGALLAPALADVSSTIAVQGLLNNATTNVPLTGTYSVMFGIYSISTGGAPLKTVTNTVSATNGQFVTLLDLTGVPFSTDYWLELNVAGETLTPRQQITPSPYSLYSNIAGTANNLGGVVFVNSTNVGIGTTSPSSKLDVRGIAQIADDGASPNTSSYASFGVTRANAAANNAYIGLAAQGQLPWAFGIDPSNSLIFGIASSSPAKTIPTPRFTLTSSGNIGIGTTSPSQKLEVAGNINVSSNGNISLNSVNQQIQFGNNNGQIYWDGTELVIKVN